MDSRESAMHTRRRRAAHARTRGSTSTCSRASAAAFLEGKSVPLSASAVSAHVGLCPHVSAIGFRAAGRRRGQGRRAKTTQSRVCRRRVPEDRARDLSMLAVRSIPCSLWSSVILDAITEPTPLAVSSSVVKCLRTKRWYYGDHSIHAAA
jgi:hypothetical protein